VQVAVKLELDVVEEWVVVLSVVGVVVIVADDECEVEDVDVGLTLEVEVDEVAVVEPPVIVPLA
jgi:hypothetical protein